MKRAIVTGAGRGIGRAIALALARDGWDVAVHCFRSVEGAEAVAAECRALGGTGEILRFDVRDRAACRDALEGFVRRCGAPHGVVLNAGTAAHSIFPAMEDEAWDGVLAANLGAFYNVLKPLVFPMVRARVGQGGGGRIVAVSSVSAQDGFPGHANYSASKAGLEGAMRSLALELAPRGITVNCVAPGFVETDMTRGADAAEILKAVPAGRAGRPEDVAAAVRFLMSDGASYVTRQTIRVDGGMR